MIRGGEGRVKQGNADDFYLSSCIKTNHKNTHLTLTKHSFPYSWKVQSHGGSGWRREWGGRSEGGGLTSKRMTRRTSGKIADWLADRILKGHAVKIKFWVYRRWGVWCWCVQWNLIWKGWDAGIRVNMFRKWNHHQLREQEGKEREEDQWNHWNFLNRKSRKFKRRICKRMKIQRRGG